MSIFLLAFKQKFLYMYNPKNLVQCFSLLHLEPEAEIFSYLGRIRKQACLEIFAVEIICLSVSLSVIVPLLFVVFF